MTLATKNRMSSVGWAAVVFLLALVVRGLYLWESKANPSFWYPVVDAAGYDQMVRHLLDTGQMKIDFFWQQFFYPAFLWVVYAISGSSVVFAKVVQLLLGGVTCVLVYRLGERIVDRRVGVIAGVMMALYGPAVLHELELVPAGWTAFWAVALLLMFLRALDKKTWGSFLLLGLCVGLSSVTRPNFLPVLLVGCVWLAWKLGGVREAKAWVGKMALVGVGFAVIVLPVAGLNYGVTGHFGFLPASGGLNLYIGNNPDYTAAEVRPGTSWGRVIVLPENAGYENDMWQRSEYFYDRTYDYLREDPGGFGEGLVRKGLQLVSSREMAGNIDTYLFARWSWVLRGLMWQVGSFGFPFGVIWPLAVVGLVFCWRRIPLVLVMMLVLYGGAVVLTHVEARYRLGVMGPIAVLAAAGCVALVEMARGKQIAKLIGAGCVAGAAIALAVLPGPFVEESLAYQAELYYGVGTNAETRAQKDHAFESYEKALAIDPDYGDAHNNLAIILAERGENDEAMAHYREALRLMSDSSDVCINVGNLLLKTGDAKGAMDNYREAIKIRPRWAQGYMGMGAALAETGKLEQAAEQYTKALEIDTDSYGVHNRLGVMRARQGRYDEAIELFDKARGLQADKAEAYRNLALTYLRLRRLDEAVENLRAVVRIEPDDADARFNLAGIYARRGKTAEAAAELRELLEIKPGDVDSRYMLGALLQKMGQGEQAERELQEVLRRDPNHVRARQKLRTMPGR